MLKNARSLNAVEHKNAYNNFQSITLFPAGDIQGFTDTYLEAISLQRQAQRSISIECTGGDLLTLPYELFLEICFPRL